MNLEHHIANVELENLPTEIAQLEATSRIVYHTEPRSPSADRFRVLRMRLRELNENAKMKSLLVTSPLPHDGKSTMVLNLATVLAEGGKKGVLVVEGDLHRPTLTQQLGLSAGPGLAECLMNRLDPMAAIRRVEPLAWYLLSAGATLSNPSEVLQAETLPETMRTLTSSFDWIVIDSPPVVPLTDTLSLAKYADSVLLVARAGQTPRTAIDEAITLVGRKRICGMILNGVEGLDDYYAGYGYY